MDIQLDEIKITYSRRNSDSQEKRIVKSSLDLYNYLLKIWDFETIDLFEEFKIVLLNQSNTVIGMYPVSKGGISSTIVEIRHIIYIALKTNSSSLALAHNHPSGNLKPSSADLKITNKIKDACNLMDIQLLDHIIMSRTNYLSLKDDGYM